jgi:hypothetical protein
VQHTVITSTFSLELLLFEVCILLFEVPPHLGFGLPAAVRSGLELCA